MVGVGGDYKVPRHTGPKLLLLHQARYAFPTALNSLGLELLMHTRATIRLVAVVEDVLDLMVSLGTGPVETFIITDLSLSIFSVF
jgi:hypothetical protein